MNRERARIYIYTLESHSHSRLGIELDRPRLYTYGLQACSATFYLHDQRNLSRSRARTCTQTLHSIYTLASQASYGSRPLLPPSLSIYTAADIHRLLHSVWGRGVIFRTDPLSPSLSALCISDSSGNRTKFRSLLRLGLCIYTYTRSIYTFYCKNCAYYNFDLVFLICANILVALVYMSLRLCKLKSLITTRYT